MVYAAATLGHWVATAELSVRFRKPVATDAELLITAEVVQQQRRIIQCRAEARAADGTLLATATGKLMQGRPLSNAERDGTW
jgi:acyl-coenzyme A thioesterase PaaI-like protein